MTLLGHSDTRNCGLYFAQPLTVLKGSFHRGGINQLRYMLTQLTRLNLPHMACCHSSVNKILKSTANFHSIVHVVVHIRP